MSCSVASIVEYIQCQLNDPEGRRYDSAKVLGYLNLANVMVRSMRPDVFGETKIVKLVPGSHQNFCEQGGCQRISKVLYTVGNDCVEADQEDDDDLPTNLCDWLSDEKCLPEGGGEDNGEYAIRKYTMDAKQPCYVRVKPPVPADKEYEVAVTCIPSAEPLCADDELDPLVCEKFLPCVIQYVMGQAMGLNVASPTAHGKSNDYMNSFFNCMQGIATADYALEVKNFYLRGEDSE